jgi:hypothetical protein
MQVTGSCDAVARQSVDRPAQQNARAVTFAASEASSPREAAPTSAQSATETSRICPDVSAIGNPDLADLRRRQRNRRPRPRESAPTSAQSATETSRICADVSASSTETLAAPLETPNSSYRS